MKSIRSAFVNPHSSIVITLRIIVGAFFIVSGYLKASVPPEEVEAVIRAYKVLPFGYAYLVALVLPWVELIPGMLLLIGIFPFYISSFIASLLCFFIILLIVTILRGVPIEDCGCLGGWIRETPPIALVRDLVLLFMILPVIRYYRGGDPSH